MPPESSSYDTLPELNDFDSDIEQILDMPSEHDDEHDDEPQTPQQYSRADTIPSSGPTRSSPIVGSPQKIRNLRLQKGLKKRQAILEKKAEEKRTAKDMDRKTSLQYVFDVLHSKNLIFWDLLEYIFNPENQQGDIRFNEFFIKKHRSTKILEWWLSSHNRSQQAKEEVREWIMNYASSEVASEARAVTKSKNLQTFSRTLDAKTVKDFDLGKINMMLHESGTGAPFTMRLLEAFATSRHVKKHSESRRERTKMVN